MDRECHTCHVSKPVSEFSVNRARKDGLTLDCKECNREKCRAYHQRNLERERERKREAGRRWRQENLEEARRRERERAPEQRNLARARHRRYKAAVLDHYGHACTCCGSTDKLTIDHMNGDGGAHRAEIRAHSAADMYRWLIRQGFPPGFQVLCVRCNMSKARRDRCHLDHGNL